MMQIKTSSKWLIAIFQRLYGQDVHVFIVSVNNISTVPKQDINDAFI